MKLSLPKLSLYRNGAKNERKHKNSAGSSGQTRGGYGTLLSSLSQISIKSINYYDEETLGKKDNEAGDQHKPGTSGLPPPSFSASQFPSLLPSSDKPEDSSTDCDDSDDALNSLAKMKKNPRVYLHQSSDHHEAVPGQLAASGQLHDHDRQKMALRKKQQSSSINDDGSTESSNSEEAGASSEVPLREQHRQHPHVRRKRNPRGHEHHKRRSHNRD